MKIWTLTLLMLGNAATFLFELATKIYQEGTAAIVKISGCAQIPLLRQ